MTEDRNNVVWRLLREVRAQQIEDGRRLTRMERRLDEIRARAGEAMETRR